MAAMLVTVTSADSRVTGGTDKGDDTRGVAQVCQEMKVPLHLARNSRTLAATLSISALAEERRPDKSAR